MSTCSVQVTGTANGVTCVGYGNCPAACCVEEYTDCTGTVGSGICNSYADCPTACCTKAATGCDGDNGFDCAQYINIGDCTSYGAACCYWGGTPGRCRRTVCPSVSQENCITCGCDVTGTCGKKACEDVSQANCESPCGCDKDGSCSYIACNNIAALYNNPDVCGGCNTCEGNWTIDDARGNVPWAIHVTGITSVGSSGSIRAASYVLTSDGGYKISGEVRVQGANLKT